MHDKILIQILGKGKQLEDLMKWFLGLNLKKYKIINKKRDDFTLICELIP